MRLTDSNSGHDSRRRTIDARGALIFEQDGYDSRELELLQESWGVVVALAGDDVHFFNTHPAKGHYSHYAALPIGDVGLGYFSERLPLMRSYRFHFALPGGRFKLGTSRVIRGLGANAMNDPQSFIGEWGPEAVDLRGR